MVLNPVFLIFHEGNGVHCVMKYFFWISCWVLTWMTVHHAFSYIVLYIVFFFYIMHGCLNLLGFTFPDLYFQQQNHPSYITQICLFLPDGSLWLVRRSKYSNIVTFLAQRLFKIKYQPALQNHILPICQTAFTIAIQFHFI